MKKLAFALLAATTLGFAAPAFATNSAAPAHDGISAAQTDVSAQRRVVKKVIVRRGPGFHRRPVARKRVVIRQRANGSTVRKVFRNGRLVRKVIRR